MIGGYADFRSKEDLIVNEDTVKVKDGKWTNRGREGTHGSFRTRKAADAQRKAMFANGYREGADAQAVRQARMFRDIDSVLKGAGVTVEGNSTNVDGLLFTKEGYWFGGVNDYYNYGTFRAKTAAAERKMTELARGFTKAGFDVDRLPASGMHVGFATRTPGEVDRAAKDDLGRGGFMSDSLHGVREGLSADSGSLDTLQHAKDYFSKHPEYKAEFSHFRYDDGSEVETTDVRSGGRTVARLEYDPSTGKAVDDHGETRIMEGDGGYGSAMGFADRMFRKYGHPESAGVRLPGLQDMNEWSDDEKKEYKALMNKARITRKDEGLDEAKGSEVNKYEDLLSNFLVETEFDLLRFTNGTYGLHDCQGANLGGIEGERFRSAGEMLDRMDIYINDYLLEDLSEAAVNSEGFDASMLDKGDTDENDGIPYTCEGWADAYNSPEFMKANPQFAKDYEYDLQLADMIANHAGDIDLAKVADYLGVQADDDPDAWASEKEDECMKESEGAEPYSGDAKKQAAYENAKGCHGDDRRKTESVHGRKRLHENTSNFHDDRRFPLLVWYEYESLVDEAQDELKDDWDAEWEKKHGDEVQSEKDTDDALDYINDHMEAKLNEMADGVSIIDESEEAELRDDIDEFVHKVKREPSEDDSELDIGDEYDFSISVRPGYFEGNQIALDVSPELPKKQVDETAAFLNEMGKKYRLTRLKTAYTFSNGETGYEVAKDEGLGDFTEKDAKQYSEDLNRALWNDDSGRYFETSAVGNRICATVNGNADYDHWYFEDFVKRYFASKGVRCTVTESKQVDECYGDNYTSSYTICRIGKSNGGK